MNTDSRMHLHLHIDVTRVFHRVFQKESDLKVLRFGAGARLSLTQNVLFFLNRSEFCQKLNGDVVTELHWQNCVQWRHS